MRPRMPEEHTAQHSLTKKLHSVVLVGDGDIPSVVAAKQTRWPAHALSQT